MYNLCETEGIDISKKLQDLLDTPDDHVYMPTIVKIAGSDLNFIVEAMFNGKIPDDFDFENLGFQPKPEANQDAPVGNPVLAPSSPDKLTFEADYKVSSSLLSRNQSIQLSQKRSCEGKEQFDHLVGGQAAQFEPNPQLDPWKIMITQIDNLDSIEIRSIQSILTPIRRGQHDLAETELAEGSFTSNFDEQGQS